MAQIDYNALADEARSGKKPAGIDYGALAAQVRTGNVTPKTDLDRELYRELNPRGEGTYRMRSREGVVAHVPYSRVTDAQGGTWEFADEDEQARYQKDFEHAPPAKTESPTLWSRLSDKAKNEWQYLTSTLPNPQPSTAHTLAGTEQRLEAEQVGAHNVRAAALRVIGGMPGFVGDLIGAVKESAETHTPDAVLNLLDPMPMLKSIKDQFSSDWAQDPQLAVQNLTGTLAGIVTVGAVTHGAAQELGEAVNVSRGTLSRASRAASDELAGIHPKTAARVVDETIAENEAAEAAARAKNAEEAAKHAIAKLKAEHETSGKEHAYHAAVNAKKEALEAQRNQEIADASLENARIHAKAAAKHGEDVKEIQQENSRIQERHSKLTERRTQENAGAEHLLELRRQRDTDLQAETARYYQKEDEVKAKAKAEENAAWQPWREKMKNVTVDGGRIAKPLERIAAQSPDVARTLRQLIPDPADAAPDSQYALDRAAIMKSQGINPEKTSYWDLPAEKRVAIDQIAASSGYEPEPIDFDPQAGVAMPIESVHRAQSILGRYIRSGRYEGPVLGEMKQVYNVLKGVETSISAEQGALGDLETARATTRRYQEAFGRERHVPRTQDEIREKTANPEAYKEREDQERLDAAGRHSPELVEAYGKVRALRQQLRDMPSEEQLRKRIRQIPPPPSVGDLRPGYRLRAEPTYRPPTETDLRQGYRLTPVPRPYTKEELETEAFQSVEQPLRTPLPKEREPAKPALRQTGEADIQAANEAELQRRIDYLRRHGIWILGSGLTTTAILAMRSLMHGDFAPAVEEAIGGAIVSPLTVVGLNKVATLLERPGIRDWLTRPTPAQLRELDRLPPEQRTAVADGLSKMRVIAGKKGWTFSAALASYIAANRAKHQEQTQ